jgi:hypothetical protein
MASREPPQPQAREAPCQLHRCRDLRALWRLQDHCLARIRDGLKPVDRKVPLLITGVELRTFLYRRMEAAKAPCQPGDIYCLARKRPKRPAGDIAAIRRVSATAPIPSARAPTARSSSTAVCTRISCTWRAAA